MIKGLYNLLSLNKFDIFIKIIPEKSIFIIKLKLLTLH